MRPLLKNFNYFYPPKIFPLVTFQTGRLQDGRHSGKNPVYYSFKIWFYFFLMVTTVKGIFILKLSSARSTFNRISLNKKCNLGVCLSQRGMNESTSLRAERSSSSILKWSGVSCRLMTWSAWWMELQHSAISLSVSVWAAAHSTAEQTTPVRR